jgi:hypothetical protein
MVVDAGSSKMTDAAQQSNPIEDQVAITQPQPVDVNKTGTAQSIAQTVMHYLGGQVAATKEAAKKFYPNGPSDEILNFAPMGIGAVKMFKGVPYELSPESQSWANRVAAASAKAEQSGTRMADHWDSTPAQNPLEILTQRNKERFGANVEGGDVSQVFNSKIFFGKGTNLPNKLGGDGPAKANSNMQLSDDGKFNAALSRQQMKIEKSYDTNVVNDLLNMLLNKDKPTF